MGSDYQHDSNKTTQIKEDDIYLVFRQVGVGVVKLVHHPLGYGAAAAFRLAER